MKDSVKKIIQLERRVMWRKRLLALQDLLVLAMMISAVTGAGFLVLARLRPITTPVWAVILGTFGLAIGALMIRWYLTRAGEGDAAFLIDDSLKLEDRIATSCLIIGRGGPRGAIEAALIEDAAARLDNHHAAAVVPFRARNWYAVLPLLAIGLAAALMIPQPLIPVDQTSVAERADIESAGEHLEQTATEIEQSVPAETETASLAKEQAEIGRGFRRTSATRSEALKRLSALEERILRRRDDLAGTRAEEIVSLADRRMGSALSTLSTARRAKVDTDESKLSPSADELSVAERTEVGSDSRVTASTGRRNTAEGRQKDARGTTAASLPQESQTKRDQANAKVANADQPSKVKPAKPLQEPVPGKGNHNAESGQKGTAAPGSRVAKGDAASSKQDSTDHKPSESLPGEAKAGEEKKSDNIDDRKADEQRTTQLPPGSIEALKAVPDSVAEQAAKALPKMSEELLKKAAELRASQLSPSDIEKLRKAAQALAGDLAQIEQSKELQKALEEMARQIRPEQIEQVARELGNQEKLKQELEAAARLLSENQQAKEMVAGLAGQFARMQDQRRQRDNNQQRDGKADLRDPGTRAGDRNSRGNRADVGAAPGRVETADRLAGRGRESGLKGKLQQRPGGEYLYLQSKAGVGAARVPYSSAYPQYRREAERSVQRSQVPPNLRSVVRKYFDAINPDAKKQ